ncbi:T9SS type A sorting domain-containing protein [uncultured Polaribacter sp.]|uniref:T9SS type A sorting domain-containing protein n=1 Tax=uncultured Polaribacter sp. TaxID=174711 RepID=UPI00259B99F5|nr:T9SS type A sorting domain-containing protein [uncultured Polaribacter sp.]
MKKTTFLKKCTLATCFFLFVFQINFSQNNNGTIDAMGDIAIIAMNKIVTPSQSDYAFVLLDDCLAGTKIFFDDDDWTGAAFSSPTGEGVSEWTNNTGKTLGAGTVIQVNFANNNGTTGIANIGQVNEIDSGFNLAAGDQLYAYIGAKRAPTVFLAFWGETSAINGTETAVLTGTKLSNGGSDLTDGITARVTSSLGFYNGSTDCNGTLVNCATMINNAASITTGTFTWPTGVKTAFKGSALPNKFFGTTNTNWATASNWGYETVPIASDHIRIPNVTNKPIISSSTGAVANNLTIDASSSLTVNSGGSIIIDGSATVNGEFIYKVSVADTNWHLISSPVVNEQYDDTWNDANGINTSGAGNNEAVATYINTSDADGDWVYYQNNAGATTFGSGTGYSMKRTGAGDYTFAGTFPPYPVNKNISANDIGGANENRWTLIGNPSPAHINIATFLSVNATPLTNTHENVYVWNAATSAYVPLATGQIHPGQGFFVNSNALSTSVTFTKVMQSDQNGVTFYKSSNPKITLSLNDGKNTKNTEINYLEGKTTGLDPRFDVGTFTGQSTSFNIYTHLLSDSEGIDFMKQALPNNNYHNMVVPIGVNANAGKEITFSIDADNFATNMKVFLEDRETNTFTRLDEANSNYKITLANAQNGIGRFYLHTTESSLSIDKNESLENVSVYKLNNTTLRITGLNQEKAEVSIFNILGKQVLKTSFTSNGVKDFALLNLSKGVYLVKIQWDSGKLNKKIVLE